MQLGREIGMIDVNKLCLGHESKECGPLESDSRVRC